MEFIIKILIGLTLMIIGILNMKGNISMLHSYHRKRVKKEDIIPFGEKIGMGTIILGSSIIIAGTIDIITSQTQIYLSNIILIIGFALGLSFIFYALLKYNKGVF